LVVLFDKSPEELVIATEEGEGEAVDIILKKDKSEGKKINFLDRVLCLTLVDGHDRQLTNTSSSTTCRVIF